MKFKLSMVALAAMASVSSAQAAGFVNGGFEDGNFNGWTVGGGSRTSVYNIPPSFNPGAAVISPSQFVPGGSLYNSTIASTHSAVIDKNYVDPRLGAKLGTTVYSGNYAARVEDTTSGGFASVLTQTVTNYTDANIFFTWKSVLLGAHNDYDAATMLITLTDKTTGTVLITRQYNAAGGGGGVDPRFVYDAPTNNFYTPDWQIEQLTIDTSLSGHDFELSVLAADCQPTAHWGYVYVDGFGNVNPPIGVPEPGSLALAGLALAGAAAARRRTKKA